MLGLIVNFAVFIAALIYVSKEYEDRTINLLLAGMSGSNLISSVSSIIMGIITFSPTLILVSLATSLLSGFFFNMFIKRAGV